MPKLDNFNREIYKKNIQELHRIEDIPDNQPPAYSKEDTIYKENIGQGWLNKLLLYTDNCIIHIVLDDSGSMLSPLNQEIIDKYKESVPPYTTPIDTPITNRIEEGVTTLYHLTFLLQKTKADFKLEFLNRDITYFANSLHQNSYTKLRNILIDFLKKDAPLLYKGTPLCKTLKKINRDSKEYYRINKDQSFCNDILILFTHGEPNDYGNDLNQMERAFKEMKELLETRQKERLNNYISIVPITDNPDDIENIIKLDTDIDRLDVSDNFFNSLKRIREVYAVLEIEFKPYMFTLYDYFVKIIIGPIDPDIDRMDKIETTVQQKKKNRFSFLQK